jgi:hypothetical protein
MKLPVMTPLALTAAVALSVGLVSGVSAENRHRTNSNAVDKCHSFTPGAANTIRNRVVGAENIGSDTIAVACVYELTEDYSKDSAVVDDITLYFRNAPSNSPVSVSCTVLPGSWVFGLQTARNDSVIIPSGAVDSIKFTGPWVAYGFGVNCNIPPNVTIAHTVLRFRNGTPGP